MSNGEKTNAVASILFAVFVKAPLWVLGQLGSSKPAEPTDRREDRHDHDHDRHYPRGERRGEATIAIITIIVVIAAGVAWIGREVLKVVSPDSPPPPSPAITAPVNPGSYTGALLHADGSPVAPPAWETP